MATRLYLRRVMNDTADFTTPHPTSEQSSATPAITWDNSFPSVSSQIYSLESTKSPIAAQVSATHTTIQTGGATQLHLVRAFTSKPMLGVTQISANTWTFNLAYKYPTADNNFWPNALNVYVWRPSTGTKVGTIIDDTSTIFGTLGTVNSQRVSHWTCSGAAVTCQEGDVIVLEVWAKTTAGAAPSGANLIYYNGSVVNTTDNASVSNHASFIETPQDIVFEDDALPTTLDWPMPKARRPMPVPAGMQQMRMIVTHDLGLSEGVSDAAAVGVVATIGIGVSESVGDAGAVAVAATVGVGLAESLTVGEQVEAVIQYARLTGTLVEDKLRATMADTRAYAGEIVEADRLSAEME